MSAQTVRSQAWLSGEARGSSPSQHTPDIGSVESIVEMAVDGPLPDIHSRVHQNGIDRRTGEMHLAHTNFELCGPLPLVWQRCYISRNRERRGELGHGWSHPFQQCITSENGQLHHHDTDGTTVSYPRPAIGQRMHCPNQCILSRYGDYLTLQRGGTVYGFEPDPWHPLRWRLVQLLTTDLTHHWQLHYDDREAGRLTGASGSWGARIRFVSGRRGWLRVTGQAQADWPERTLAHYHLDRHGDLIAVRDCSGRLSQYRYSNHLCRLQRTAGGTLRRFDWDTSRDEPRCTRAGEVRYHWDTDGRTSQAVCPQGRTDSLVFDAEDRLVLHRNGDGELEHWQYDDQGRLRARSGPEGSHRFDYDDRGRLIRHTAPRDRTILLQYQKDRRRPSAVVDDLGHRTAFQYRFDGRPTAVHHPDGREEHWTYQHDRLVRYRDRHNHLHRYIWDETLGLLARYECVALIDSIHPFRQPNGQVTLLSELTFEFDDRGRMLSRAVHDDREQRLEHDEFGRLCLVHDDQGRTWRFDYDGTGRLAVQTHPSGSETHFRYEWDARPVAIVLPGGDEVRCDPEVPRPVSELNDQLSPYLDFILERQALAGPCSQSRAIPAMQEFLLDYLIGPDSLTGLRTSNPPKRYGAPATGS